MDDFGSRIFLAELPAPLPIRRHQDRPLLRQRSSGRTERPRLEAGERGNLGGGKECSSDRASITVLGENLGISTTAEGVKIRRAVCPASPAGLLGGAGLLHQPAATRRRGRGAAAATGHLVAGDRWAPRNGRQRRSTEPVLAVATARTSIPGGRFIGLTGHQALSIQRREVERRSCLRSWLAGDDGFRSLIDLQGRG